MVHGWPGGSAGSGRACRAGRCARRHAKPGHAEYWQWRALPHARPPRRHSLSRARGSEPERGGTASGSCGVSYGGNSKLTVRPVMLVNGCGPSVRDLRNRLAPPRRTRTGRCSVVVDAPPSRWGFGISTAYRAPNAESRLVSTASSPARHRIHSRRAGPAGRQPGQVKTRHDAFRAYRPLSLQYGTSRPRPGRLTALRGPGHAFPAPRGVRMLPERGVVGR